MSRRSAEDVEKGLRALVLHAGNGHAAEKDCGIPAATLNSWRRDVYRERYEALREQHERTVDRELGEDLLGAAKARLDTANNLVADIETARQNRDWDALKALSVAAKNLDVGTGITNQHSRIIREKPTEITEHKYELSVVEAAIRQLSEGAIDVEAKEIS